MTRSFDWINALPRKVGHTSAACGKSEGRHVVITGSAHEARRLRREHAIDAISLEYARSQLLGKLRPVVFDLDAVQHIVNEYERQLAQVRHRISALEHSLTAGHRN